MRDASAIRSEIVSMSYARFVVTLFRASWRSSAIRFSILARFSNLEAQTSADPPGCPTSLALYPALMYARPWENFWPCFATPLTMAWQNRSHLTFLSAGIAYPERCRAKTLPSLKWPGAFSPAPQMATSKRPQTPHPATRRSHWPPRHRVACPSGCRSCRCPFAMDHGAGRRSALQMHPAIHEANARGFQRVDRAAQVRVRGFGDGVAGALPGANGVVGKPSTLGQFVPRQTCQRAGCGELCARETNHVKIVFGFVIIGN